MRMYGTSSGRQVKLHAKSITAFFCLAFHPRYGGASAFIWIFEFIVGNILSRFSLQLSYPYTIKRWTFRNILPSPLCML